MFPFGIPASAEFDMLEKKLGEENAVSIAGVVFEPG
jgi:hypothetical protein